MSWNSVDIGEEEYCCQNLGHGGWGPCQHSQERYDAEQESNRQREIDFQAERRADRAHIEPTWFHADCRYERLRAFHTQIEADTNAVTIRAQVEFNGGVYVPLAPFHCPDADHWHLSRA